MKTITLNAHAKVNLRLDVLRKRPDGYHDLCMIMQKVDLCDTVTVALTEGQQIGVRCDDENVPSGEGNIVWKSAAALLNHCNCRVGLDISIQKRIPVAAGLGGGSSDAAAVLDGVNRLLGFSLPKTELMAIGSRIGADVPFFLYGPVAVAEGIGDQLSPVGHIPRFWTVLVNPRVSVSTAWVYGNLQLTEKNVEGKFPRSFADVESVAAILSNDLEAVTLSAYPVVGIIRERLVSLGALNALMSGSGPTVFGLFADERRAQQAADQLQAESPWFVAVAANILE